MTIRSRLLGGRSGLASAARALLADDSSGASADADVLVRDDDDDDDNGQASPAAVEPAPGAEAAAPVAEAIVQPAAAAAPAPATSALDGVRSAEATAEQVEWFNAGVASRNDEVGEVFSARAAAAEGQQGELIVAGREAAAAELLAAGLSTEQTIKTLGRLPKGASGDAMLGMLKAQAQAPATPPGGEASSKPIDPWNKAAKKLGWDKS